MNKIVLVDTGIDTKSPLFENSNNISGVAIRRNKDGLFSVESAKENTMVIHDDIGHGTAIAYIIRSHNPNAELFVVKIFSSDTYSTDEELLVFALEYIIENVEFDIVNLSLGVNSIEEGNRLEAICDKYYNHNKVIISAYENKDGISFPAAFNNVLGVTSGESCYLSTDYFFVEGKMVNICAKGQIQKLQWSDGLQIASSGNSFACAHFSGILSTFGSFTTWPRLFEKIQENSKGVIQLGDISPTPLVSPVSSYKKAVIFPFNKEAHSIVRFSSNLPFKLVDVYDSRYSAQVGASTNKILHDNRLNNYIIKNIASIDWDTFDTFILGHTDELSKLVRHDIKESLIPTIISHNKSLYAFDDISEYLGECNYSNVFFPHVSREQYVPAPFGKLYRQDKPVVGIFGTRSRQGKFTLQLKLRYSFLKQGYKIFQVGTEPSALLYGMEAVFPSGYNSTIDIVSDESVVYLNKLLYEGSRNSDFIVFGGQSSVITLDEGNIKNFNYKAIDMLYGCLPDVVVLCVNVYDDMSIIYRTKNFIESIIECKVVALVVYPYYYEEDDIYTQRLIPMSDAIFRSNYKQMLENKFGIPVYYPNSTLDVDCLCDNIIECFK